MIQVSMIDIRLLQESNHLKSFRKIFIFRQNLIFNSHKKLTWLNFFFNFNKTNYEDSCVNFYILRFLNIKLYRILVTK